MKSGYKRDQILVVDNKTSCAVDRTFALLWIHFNVLVASLRRAISSDSVFIMAPRGSSLSRDDSERSRVMSYSAFDASLYAPVRPISGGKPVLALDQAAYNMALYFHKGGGCGNAPAKAAKAIGSTECFVRRAMSRLKEARKKGIDAIYGSHRRGGVTRTLLRDLTEKEKSDIVYAYHEMIMNNEHVTLESLNSMLRQNRKYWNIPEMCNTSLSKVLKNVGIVYGTISLNKVELQMRPELVAWRLRFLQKIQEYRREGYEIAYTDETWYHVNDRPRRAWQHKKLNEFPQLMATDERLSTGPKTPGKGQRLILFDVISEQRGKIPDCFAAISGLKANGDYHKTLDSARFLQLFREKVLENANVKTRTVVCIDNARYHSERNKTTRIPLGPKTAVVAWCKKNGVEYKGRLVDMQVKLRQMQRERDATEGCTYLLEQSCEEHRRETGKDVRILRLPPYHCFLNAIEMYWSVLKEGARKKSLKLTKRTPSASIKLLQEQYNEITVETAINECNHARKLQEAWLERDLEVNNKDSSDCTQKRTLASIDSTENNISANATPIDDEADFDAMVEELLEDLRIEPEDSESSESSSEESEEDE